MVTSEDYVGSNGRGVETNASRRANSEYQSLNIVIYHFQDGIVYSAEIFQRDKSFQHFRISEVPASFIRNLGNVPFCFFKES